MCADVGRGRQVDRYWHTLLGGSALSPRTRSHSQPRVVVLAGNVLEGPAGWLGQHKTQREPKYGRASRHEKHASQADVSLQLRNEEHSYECTELADSRGDTMPGCTHAHGEYF